MKTNQKGFIHFIIIFFLALIIFGAIFVKYNSYKNKIKVPKTIIIPTESQVSPTSEPVQNKWLSYNDPIAGFTIDYPNNWSYNIISETTSQPADENGVTGFAGQVKFVGPSSELQITFGDGFGGAPCGEVDTFFADGKIEKFTVNNQDIVQCKILSTKLEATPKYIHTWVGSCGNCGLLKKGYTSFVFGFDSNSEDLNQTDIPKMLSSFKFTL